jgi:HEAT repeat protein
LKHNAAITADGDSLGRAEVRTWCGPRRLLALLAALLCCAGAAPVADDDVAAAVADAKLVAGGKDDQQAVLRLKDYPPEALRAAVGVLVEGMASSDQKARVAAYDGLGLIGPDAEAAVPALLTVARGKDPWERTAAFFALGRIRRRSAEVVPVLAEGLKSADMDQRRIAGIALQLYGPDAAPAVPALVELLRHPVDEWDRDLAAMTLASIGPAAAPAVADLLPMLKSPQAQDRSGAARALGRIGVTEGGVVLALTGALGDRDEEVVGAALLGLGDLGRASAGALPLVREVRPTEKNELALWYARVRLGDADAGLARLRELARAEPPKLEVFETIALLKAQGVPLLAEVIRGRGAGTKWAIEALGKVGPEAAAGVPVIVALVKEGRQPGPKAARFDAAVKALGAIGPAAAEALPTLRDVAQKHANPNVRRSAAAAVRRIERPT